MFAGKDHLIERLSPRVRVDWAQPVGARRSHRSHRTAALEISHCLTVSRTDSGYAVFQHNS